MKHQGKMGKGGPQNPKAEPTVEDSSVTSLFCQVTTENSANGGLCEQGRIKHPALLSMFKMSRYETWNKRKYDYLN